MCAGGNFWDRGGITQKTFWGGRKFSTKMRKMTKNSDFLHIFPCPSTTPKKLICHAFSLHFQILSDFSLPAHSSS